MIEDKGSEIRSFSKTMEYLVENDGYTEKDFEGIQIFADEKLVERRIKTDDLANNESFPSGWKTGIRCGAELGSRKKRGLSLAPFRESM